MSKGPLVNSGDHDGVINFGEFFVVACIVDTCCILSDSNRYSGGGVQCQYCDIEIVWIVVDMLFFCLLMLLMCGVDGMCSSVTAPMCHVDGKRPTNMIRLVCMPCMQMSMNNCSQ